MGMLLQRLRNVPVEDKPAAPTPFRATLAQRLGATEVRIPDDQILAATPSMFRSDPVSMSSDLARVINIPRRTPNAIASNFFDCLKTPTNDMELFPIQAWALHEAGEVGGLLAPIGVGAGKTLITMLLPMVMLECRVALLLIPPNMRAQFEANWITYGEHWKLPNRAGGRYFHPDRPVLHVYAYSKLSSAKSTELLEEIKPDLIIADEAHNLRRASAARTKRFTRYLRKHPHTRCCLLSGTITSRSVKDYWHLSEVALGDSSPLPLHWPTVEEWAGLLDSDVPPGFRRHMGEFSQLCKVGETARQAFRRRLVDTAGVVATEEGALGTSLVIEARRPAVPPGIAVMLADLNRTYQRPDGEELVDAVSMWRVARELASGFFYRWIYPRGEPSELIEQWFEARKAWHKDLREKLKQNRPHLDSPLLCARAAMRAHGDLEEAGVTWDAPSWPAWRDVRELVQPESEAVWVDDFLVRDCVAWLKEHTGIVWYEHASFGEAIAKASGAPFFGPGDEASVEIAKETGKRSIVASIRAHGTGKNLQMFRDNLVANVPSNGAVWEQLLGRTHRPGQGADEVGCTVFQHAESVVKAFEDARRDATYIQESTGSKQKLVYANYDLFEARNLFLEGASNKP